MFKIQGYVSLYLANLAAMLPPAGPDFGVEVGFTLKYPLNFGFGRWLHAEMENRSKLTNPPCSCLMLTISKKIFDAIASWKIGGIHFLSLLPTQICFFHLENR